MAIKNKIKHYLSFLLHGETKPLYANISYLQPNNTLSGKKIIITGGNKGIGCAIAKKCINEGAKVLIAGRDETSLQTVSKELNCQYLKLDLLDFNSYEGFLDEANRMLSGANCLVNNAGISLHEDGFLEVNEKGFDLQFDTNLKGAFFLTQQFIKKHETKDPSGMNNILFISSETSVTVDERPYGISKSALNSLIQGLAYRFVNKGFRINGIAPGITATDMVGFNNSQNLSYDNISGRLYLPEEVAEIASFLLSDASNCLNGQILVCNEGKTINARWR